VEPDAAAPLQAADAPASAPPPSEESAPVAAAEAAAQENAFMNAIIRGATADAANGATLNQDDGADGAEADDDANGEPARSQRDAKPDGQQLGRRSRRAEEAAQRLAALEAENEQLKAQLAPPIPQDASEQERAAILASEDRYRRLLAKPDDDADWSQDDYVWLQDEKRKRALLPDVTRHFETVIEQERRLARESVEREQAAFWAQVGNDLASAADLPGVDLEALKKAPTFADRDRMVYAAATARRDGEIKALREELADAKRQLLGIVRPPLNGGRSAPGRTYDENGFMNSLIRGGTA